jgi:hypothetical protein
VSEVVGPAEIPGRQTLGVLKRALRLVVEPRRHESLAYFAKSVGANLWRAARLKRLDQDRVCLRELFLNGGVDTTQVRQGHFQQRLRASVDHPQRDRHENRDETAFHTQGCP